jgi:ubiquinone/menaquinone biosynthesis C-methylase UbiE
MPTEGEIGRVTRTREQARASYDRLSRWYDLLAARSERESREAGLRLLGVREGERALEVGPGTGQGLVSLARSTGRSGRVCGVDLSLGMIQRASRRVRRAGLADRVALLRGDATRLPLRSGTFDAAFTAFTLEQFDTPEIPVVLAECCRVLRPEGRLAVVSLTKRACLMTRLYEVAHRLFPVYVDCRPIYVQRSMEEAGFHTRGATEVSMWGMPVEIVVGGKRP